MPKKIKTPADKKPEVKEKKIGAKVQEGKKADKPVAEKLEKMDKVKGYLVDGVRRRPIISITESRDANGKVVIKVQCIDVGFTMSPKEFKEKFVEL